MSLADLRKLPSIKEILDKQKKVEKPKTKQKAGNSLITRIQNITSQVQTRLGKYEKDFELITTQTRLHEYIDKCIENGIISIDTETTGLDPICDQIVGACIYTYNEKAAYIPINHISYITNVRVDNQLNEEQVAKEFQRLVDAKTKVIMFNAKFDIRVIRNQLGVYMTPSWCGFIAGKCLKENEEEGNLKYLWKKYCSPDKEAEHFTFDKMFEGLRFNIIPISSAYLYAAKDALMTMELYDFQKEYLDVNNEKCKSLDLTRLAKLYHEIELPIINIVADIEDTGVAIDVDYCNMLSKKYNDLLKEQEQKFYTELNNYSSQINSYLQTNPESKIETPLNLYSSAQLAELFYDVLKLPSVNKKQPRGTGEPILMELNHPLSKLILECRGTKKLLTTYIDKMPNVRNKKTGRIHCKFNQVGADSGRFSSSDPNLQNIPSHNKDIRKLFVATKQIDINMNKDNILNLLWGDKIQTQKGFKLVQDLTCQDILVNDMYQLQITNVESLENNILITTNNYINNKFNIKRQYILIGSDYSQQEPKITADLSNDEQFIQDCASGKDAYATIASIAFNVSYEDCLEFYLDENGNKTHEVNKEGKERRTQAKSILLGICYGRTIKTIAEQLNCTEEKAQQIYDAVLTNIPGLKSLMYESEEMARINGWVETKWGRRRHLPDMQLPKYELHTKGNKVFDPFFDSKELGVVDEIEIRKQEIIKELDEAKYYNQKLKIKDKIEKEGYYLVDNTRKIEDATRQCLNSRIQGSAADQTKIAMRLIGENEQLTKLGFRMLLLVHDEIIGECPFINAQQVIPIFLQCMLDAAKDLRTGAKCDETCSFAWYGPDLEKEELTREKLLEVIQNSETVK